MGKKLIAILFILFGVYSASGQYYDWGQNPASVRWMQTGDEHVKYIYPEYYERQAARLMKYMDTVRTQIGYGFRHGPMKRMPLIMQTQNFSANGIVMLAPRRMEFIVNPEGVASATPWLKQLAAHEYRHAVQYNNLNRGIIRGLSWFLGEQGSLVGMAFLPMWVVEGDAVMAETQMTTFGRGLQPSFTMGYRAMLLEGEKYPRDKYFSGSYKDYLPGHYELGYQMVTWAYTHFGENIWDKVSWYAARNPYFILPTGIALRKFYGTSERKLFDATFEDLERYWRSLPLEDNSARIIPTKTTSYTTYKYPVEISEGKIAALKSDYDRSSRIVMVDTATGNEEVLCRTGSVNTGLVLSGRYVYWTELRQSTFWEQKVNSQLCYYDLSTGRKGTVNSVRNAMYPTAVTPPAGTVAGDSHTNRVAWVEYGYDGTFEIVFGDRRFPIPDNISVHGLAYEKTTGALFFIGLSDNGMWIGTVDPNGDAPAALTMPSYATITNLRAGDGKLYFNSIQSGKDEAHMLTLDDLQQYRVSTSRYGSFQPSESADGERVYMTTYTPDGYLLSQHALGEHEPVKVVPARLPENVVNPPRIDLGLANIDDVIVKDTAAPSQKRYRKGTHLFKVHSWAPVDFDAYRLINEAEFDLRLGVTVLSQNELNSTFTQLNYGWTGDNSVVKAKVNYYGWAPKIELEAQWSDAQRLLYLPANENIEYPNPGSGNYFDITARTYLPLLLSSGASTRRLTPMIEFSHTNARLYNFDTGSFNKGLRKIIFTLQYAENQPMAYRDFLPRFGYLARVSYTSNPFESHYGSLWSAYGRVYLPGIMPHHSLMVRGAVQHQEKSMYNYTQKELYPRGARWNIAPTDYQAFSVDYQFPLWCPDGGINSIVYFRRIRLNIATDQAWYTTGSGAGKSHGRVWSYGGGITFDIVPLRMPSNTVTSVGFTIFKPSDKDKPVFGFSISLPI